MAAKKPKKRIRLTQEQIDNIKRYVGLTVLVIALFTLLSIVSYLFTWKIDAGLAKNADFTNWCGNSGYVWARLLVSRCFGLGSFFLVFLLGAVSYKLITKKSEFGLLRIAFITVSGTFLSSLLFSYVSMLVSDDVCFGGGLGGDAGSAVIGWLSTMIGMTITGFLVALLVLGWMILSSSRFRYWFSVVGDAKDSDLAQDDEPQDEDPQDEAPQDDEQDQDDTGDPVVDEEPEPEPEIEPEQEPEIEPDPAQDDTKDTGIEVVRADDLVADVVEELPPFDNRLLLSFKI